MKHRLIGNWTLVSYDAIAPDGALNPAWVGGDQVRQVQFLGDLLVLQADVLRNHQKIRHVLTWRKLP